MGLDIESDARLTRKDPLALARRYFSPAELADLEGELPQVSFSDLYLPSNKCGLSRTIRQGTGIVPLAPRVPKQTHGPAHARSGVCQALQR